MKNLPLIISIVAILGVGTLFALHFGNAPKTGTVEEIDINDTIEVEQMEASNIAYVRIDSLLMNYYFYIELEGKLKKRQASLEAELNRKVGALEKEMEEFQYKAQNGLFLSETSYQSQAEDLYAKREQLAYSEQQITQQLMEEGAAMEGQILDTVLTFMKRFNHDKRYRYIMNAGNLLYGEKVDDITDTVLSALNQRYKMNNPVSEGPDAK